MSGRRAPTLKLHAAIERLVETAKAVALNGSRTGDEVLDEEKELGAARALVYEAALATPRRRVRIETAAAGSFADLDRLAKEINSEGNPLQVAIAATGGVVFLAVLHEELPS